MKSLTLNKLKRKKRVLLKNKWPNLRKRKLKLFPRKKNLTLRKKKLTQRNKKPKLKTKMLTQRKKVSASFNYLRLDLTALNDVIEYIAKLLDRL